MYLPLAGVRIVAVEQFGAGPWGTMQLADLGAEVIKVEHPERGDFGRDTGPFHMGPHDSGFYQTFNRNKRSLTLDLKQDAGQAVFHRLVATADAVMNNLRGEQPAKLGLTYDALKGFNPRIVCGHLSAYGRTGERAGWPGFDHLLQAECGFLHVTGAPEDPPTRFGLSMVDYVTGVTMALALVSGILGARLHGRGCDLDCSLYDVALQQTNYPATYWLNFGYDVGRAPRSAHPTLTPAQTLKTADGWIFVMVMSDKFWRVLVDGLDDDRLRAPDYADFAARLANRAALTELLDGIFQARPTAAWLDHFAGKLPVAPVLDLRQALESPFAIAQQMIQHLPHPERPDFRMLANAIMVDGGRLPGRHAPALGADTDAVLAEIGYDEAAVAELRRNEVIRG